MDFDGSLTPPLSPGMLVDSEPFAETSPVLVVKHKSVRPYYEDDSFDIVQKYTEYSDPLSCGPCIYRSDYGVDSCMEKTFIGEAHSYWNTTCVLLADGSHICEESYRSVMNEKRCLNELADTDQADNIVYEAMMYFQDLEDCAKLWMKSMNTNNGVNAAKRYRKLLHEALCFISEFVQQLVNQDDVINNDSIIKVLNLLIMMRNQSKVVLQHGLKSIVREDVETTEIGGRSKCSPVKEWLHVYVDIQTTVMKIIPIISKVIVITRHLDSMQVLYDNGIEILDQDFLWKIIRSNLTDVMKLAIEKYNQLIFIAKNDKGQFVQSILFNTSPFPCLCIQQLLSMCIHTAAKIQSDKVSFSDMDSMDTQSNRIDNESDDISFKRMAPSFWKICLTFINTVIQNAQNKNPKDEAQPTKGPEFPLLNSVQDALSFSWWFTWHISHLFSFDTSGNYKVNSVTSTSYLPLLSRLIRMSLSTCESDSKLLASHMMCYQAISSFWRRTSPSSITVTSAEIAPLHPLWAHFSRKLNAIKKSDKGIHKYASREDKTLRSQLWIIKCEKYLKYDKTYLADESQIIYDDAFDIFLSILGNLLGIGCWPQLKDRFYSRLLSNEIKNLTVIGMSRLFQLFILISLSCEDNMSRTTVFTKLLEYLNSAYLGKTDYKKQKVMLTGLFSCMQISMRYSMKMFEIATKCGKMMSLILKLFASTERNVEQRNSLWKIISFYFQNLTEICQTTRSFDLGQHLIVPINALQVALTKSRSSECLILLETFSNVLSSISSHLKHSTNKESITGAVQLYQNITVQCFPWLKERSKSEEIHCEEIVNVVVEMCGLTLQIKETSTEAQSFTLQSIVEYFGCSVEVRLRTRYLFLIGILSHETTDILSYFNEKNPESNCCRILLIQGCLKCILSHPHENDQTHLMMSLSQLNNVKEILKCDEANTNAMCLENFLRVLESRYNSSKTFMERKERKEQAASWFNPLSDVLQTFAKSYMTDNREVVMNVYRSCGLIILHCSKLLYTTGKSGIMTQIFDTLVLPRWIYTSRDKNLNQSMLKALHQTLHMYFLSLLCLDYKRDSYIQRVMNDIITIYFIRFPAATNAILHPFCRVLSNHNITTDQRSTVIRLLKEYCRNGPNSDTKLTMVIEILHSWSESVTIFTNEEKMQLSPILEQAKSTLRSLPALMTKVHFIHSLC